MTASSNFDRETLEWIATNLLRGTGLDVIRRTLREDGEPEERVGARLEEVATEILASPAFAAAQPFVAEARRLEMIRRRADALARAVPESRGVSRCSADDPRRFFREFVAEGIPVILEDFADAMPAFEDWDFDALRARAGEIELAATKKRAFDPKARHVASETFRCTFAELLDHAETHESTPADPGFYLVAAQHSLSRELSSLRADVRRDPRFLEVDPDGERTLLWLGPRGTRTDVHHDDSHVLMVQIRGRKKVQLVSPLDPTLMAGARVTYNEVHLDHEDFREAWVREAELQPGDALFIPMGYWHAVVALDPSITVSLTGLAVERPPRFRLDGTV